MNATATNAATPRKLGPPRPRAKVEQSSVFFVSKARAARLFEAAGFARLFSGAAGLGLL
jgi:hypothetical protein